MMTTIKVYAFFTVKIYKNKPPKKFKQGRAPSAPVLDPPLLSGLERYISILGKVHNFVKMGLFSEIIMMCVYTCLPRKMKVFKITSIHFNDKIEIICYPDEIQTSSTFVLWVFFSIYKVMTNFSLELYTDNQRF